MRRTLCFLACAILPALLACGRQMSEELDAGGGCVQPAPSDLQCFAGTCGSASPVCNSGVWACPANEGLECPAEDDAGGCSGNAPQLYCDVGCGQSGWYTAQCIGEQWSCPEFDLPLCLEDAGGYDACAYGSPVACAGTSSCGLYPVCADGVWSCSDAGQCEDAAPPSFSCGDLACDPATSYCQIDTGGPVLTDGGVGSSYQCVPLPQSCNGIQATCDCAAGGVPTGSGCGCVAENGDVIVTCVVP